MKTILVDAIDGLISDTGEVFAEMYQLLETYPNPKIILTGADDEGFKKYKLDQAPYEVFTLKHNPEKTDSTYFKMLFEHYNLKPEEVIYFEHNQQAVKSAQSVGITSYWYDHTKEDLVALKLFLDKHVA
jgi:FMN phosphatase YigB (HAD superfamily)